MYVKNFVFSGLKNGTASLGKLDTIMGKRQREEEAGNLLGKAIKLATSKKRSGSDVAKGDKRSKRMKSSSTKKTSSLHKSWKKKRSIGWTWQLVGDRWIRQAKPGYFDVRRISREFVTAPPPEAVIGQGNAYYVPGVFYPGDNERELLRGLAEIGYELLPKKKEAEGE